MMHKALLSGSGYHGQSCRLSRSTNNQLNTARSRLNFSCRAELSKRADVELPQGTLWLDKAFSKDDVVYGQSFVLQRPRRGGPGLVLDSQQKALKAQGRRPAGSITVKEKAGAPVPMRTAGMWDVDVTEYSFLAETFALGAGAQRGLLPPPRLQATECLDIVLVPSEEQEADTAQPRNPRRKRKVEFTCNLCGAVNTKPVSLHAWEKGSVFARCEGCSVIHKLVDNLNLCHEISGHIFTDPMKLEGLRIPEGLPQRPALDYHVHPAVYPLLPRDE